MKNTFIILISLIFSFSSCEKSPLDSDFQNKVSFKVNAKDNDFSAEIKKGIWETAEYFSDDSAPFGIGMKVINRSDSTILIARLVYNVPKELGATGCESLSITFMKRESFDNLDFRENTSSSRPIFDYPNQADIIKNMFPKGKWTSTEDLKVMVEFNQCYVLTHTTSFPSEGNNFHLSKAEFIPTEHGFGKVQLEGKFECSTHHYHSAINSVFEIMDGEFSAILNL